MRTCPVCSTSMPDDVRFCPECGARQPESAAPPSTPPLPSSAPTVRLPETEANSQATERLDQPEDVVEPAAPADRTIQLPSSGLPTSGTEDRTIQIPPSANPPGALPPTPPPYVPPAYAPPPEYAPPPSPVGSLPPSSVGSLPPGAGTAPATEPRRGPNRVLLLVGGGCLLLLLAGACIVGIFAVVSRQLFSTIDTSSLASTAIAVQRTPVPVVEAGRVIFEDDFENPNRSDFAEDDSNSNAIYAFGDGTYDITVTVDNYIAWAGLPDTYSDGVAEVETLVEEGGAQDVASGFLFRYQDQDNFYMFEVAVDGTYHLVLYENNEPRDLIGWTTASEINGPGEINRIRLVLDGDLIGLYVNDELLDEVSDDTFLDGELAIVVSTAADADATVKFDNLVVRELR